MDETRKKVSTGREGSNRVAFWGTIVQAVILLLLSAVVSFLLFSGLTKGPGTGFSKAAVLAVVLVVIVVIVVMNLAGLVLTFRGRQAKGYGLTFYSLLVFMVGFIALVQGRAPFVSFFVLVVSAFGIGWLCPPRLRLSYAVTTAIALGLAWGIEWIRPPWRLTYTGGQVGPIAAVVFALIFGVLLFFQTRKAIARRFLSMSLGAKFLISILGTTGLAMLIFGVFVLYRNQQSQNFWSGQLQNTVQQQSRQQMLNTAQTQADNADQQLSKISMIVEHLADYRATFFSGAAFVGQGSYWDGNKKLELLPGGQYGNSASDLASVFIPNIVTLDPAMVDDLNGSMYLDFLAPAALRENPQIIAVYYIGASNYSVYYPNIGLASAVSPDFNLLTQVFYTIATPKNDPQHTAVWTPPYQDPAGTGLIVTTSVPVYDQSNQFRGVMSADVQLSKISKQISAIQFGKTGFAFLIDPAGHIISMPDAGYALFGIQPESVPSGESPKTTLLGLGAADFQDVTHRMSAGENGIATVPIHGTTYYVAYSPLPTIGYSIGLIAPTAQLDAAYLAAQQRIGSQTRLSTILSIAITLALLLAAAGISILLSRFLSAPVAHLTKVAAQVSAGNLEAKADVQTTDEIGILANAFNTMTAQLRGMFATLEQRVAERTQSLKLAADVGRSVSQVRALDVMLRDAAEIIRSRFDLYYAQVYLTNPEQTELVLQAGTGTVGSDLLARGHHLLFNTGSINGRAAVERRSVVISDTTTSANFRPNPLLPDTRSEMAIPLMIGEKVVGVLDLQSRNIGALSEELLPALEALAGQLAVAIQNASLLAETEQARADVEIQVRRLVRSNWQDYLDAIHKPERTGFLYERNRVVPVDAASKPLSENALTAPIAVTGEPVGSLAVELEAGQPTAQNVELVNTIAHQVAQQIENLRLLDSAERYRSEAEQAARRLTREGWKNYLDARPGDHLGYLYNLKQVVPADGNGDKGEAAITLPLRVRDETVGRLAIMEVEPQNAEAKELADAVAERLGAHIESLRQFDATQSALAQSEKLFDASRLLTQATDLQELVKAAVGTLNIARINRAVLATFNYDPTDSLESLDIVANWWDGSGHDVTPIGTHYPLDVIRVMPMFVSPTPVFFDDTFNDERVDAVTLELVKRQNLRAVGVLPLHLGSRQVGALILEAEEPHNFTQEEIRLFSALAPQIATTLENRRQFERAQRQADREAMLNSISQKIQSATSVEDVLQIAARELGHALGAPLTIAQLGRKNGKDAS